MYLPSSYWVCVVPPAICTYDQHFCLRILPQKSFLQKHVASQHPLQASSKHCVPAESDLRPERKSSNVASPKLQTSRLNSDTMWNTSRVHRLFEMNSVGFFGGTKCFWLAVVVSIAGLPHLQLLHQNNNTGCIWCTGISSCMFYQEFP